MESLENRLNVPKVHGIVNNMPFFARASYLQKDGKRIVNAALSLKEIDARRISANTSPAPAQAATNSNEQLVGIDLFEPQSDFNQGIAYHFDFLRHINFMFDELNFSAKANKVRYGLKSHVSDINISGSMKQGQLRIEDFSANSTKGPVKADLVIDYQTLTPTLSVGLEVDEIDLSHIMLPKKPQGDGTPSYLWSTTPIDLGVLKGTSGRFKLKTKKLKLGNVLLEKVKGDFGLYPEKISIDRLNARAFGGEIDIKGGYGLDVTVLTLAVQGTKLSVPKTMKNMFGINGFSDGVYNFSAGLSTAGAHVAEMIGSLEGTFSFSSRDIKMKGFDLLGLSDRLFTLTAQSDAEYWTNAMLRSGETDLGIISANGEVRAGAFILENIPMSTGLFTSASFRTHFDVYNWRQRTFASFAVRSRREYSRDIPVTVSLTGRLDIPRVAWKEKPIITYWERFYYR